MKKSGLAAVVLILIVVAVVAIVLGVASILWYISGYNEAIRLEQEAQQAWANVDAQLQRRLDLIPNLVETVKGYAGQEKGIFENIAQARTKYFQANTVGQKIEASNELTGLLSRLLVLREAYPELKSNQNFLALQDQLEGTENRISVARTRYNEAVKALNTYARSVFGSWFARAAGVKPMPYFETSEQARKAPPKVNFGAPAQPAPSQPNQPAPQPAP